MKKQPSKKRRRRVILAAVGGIVALAIWGYVYLPKECDSQTTTSEAAPNILQIKAKWKELLNASDELTGKAAIIKIKELAAQVPSDRRVACILAMMEVKIPDSAARTTFWKRRMKVSTLAIFGDDPLPPDAVKFLLAAEKLDTNRDLLLCGYYELMETSVTKGPITKQGGQLLIRLLSEEIATAAGRNLSREKKERLIALDLSTLNSSQETRDLWKAMESYRTKAPKDDLLALYIRGWQQVKDGRTAGKPLKKWERAVLNLGHWSETARYSAANRLGEAADDKKNTRKAILKAIDASLSDPRPLVQKAAATACQRHNGSLPQATIEKLVVMLNSKKPQYSYQAALALSRHVKDPGADKALQILWEKLVKPVRGSLEKRGAWLAMSRYQVIMTPQQKRKLCEQAVKDLHDYTFNVLGCLEDMGRDASPARKALEEFGKTTKSGNSAALARRILRNLPPSEGGAVDKTHP